MKKKKWVKLNRIMWSKKEDCIEKGDEFRGKKKEDNFESSKKGNVSKLSQARNASSARIWSRKPSRSLPNSLSEFIPHSRCRKKRSKESEDEFPLHSLEEKRGKNLQFLFLAFFFLPVFFPFEILNVMLPEFQWVSGNVVLLNYLPWFNLDIWIYLKYLTEASYVLSEAVINNRTLKRESRINLWFYLFFNATDSFFFFFSSSVFPF